MNQYDTTPITKPQQAQEPRDTSDNSYNSLLSLDPQTSDNSDSEGSNDSDYNDLIVYDPGNESDLSNHDRVSNQGGEDCKVDIEDTSTRDNADSSVDDEYIVYDFGGISTSNAFSGATQASTTNNDTTDNSNPSSTPTPFPFDHDAADRIDTRSDTNGLGDAANLDISTSSPWDRTPTRDDDDSTDSSCNSTSSRQLS